MFNNGETVKHVKSGGVYVVIDTPDDLHRLEHSNERYFSYCPLSDKYAMHKRIWIRCESEMTDGRFIPIT